MNKKQKKNLIRIAASAVLILVIGQLGLQGLPRLIAYLVPYLIVGYDILYRAGRGIVKRQPFDECLLMAVATLGALALDLNSIKITFESFPILLGALLFGPLDGLAVGFVGTLLYQLRRYGVSVTTPRWELQ